MLGFQRMRSITTSRLSTLGRFPVNDDSVTPSSDVLNDMDAYFEAKESGSGDVSNESSEADLVVN